VLAVLIDSMLFVSFSPAWLWSWDKFVTKYISINALS
jgi:hypothetical protein